ncbi:unnamed protein product [Scytosiphon promiscuus]
MRALMLPLSAMLLAESPGVASQTPAARLEPSPDGLLAVRVIDGEANSGGYYEAMTMVVSTITEIGPDGKPVGVDAASTFSLDSGNISIFSATRNTVDEDGLPAEEVSMTAITLELTTSATLLGANYLDGGTVSTFEPNTPVEVGNETVRLDVRISDWAFCTPFGRDGGRRCLADSQDILLEREGALPTPAPPHTLLIPRCDGDTVATLRFVCDVSLPECIDIVSVKFYLGEADQDPGRAPNTATITVDANYSGNATRNVSIDDFDNDAMEAFGSVGVYEHNLTNVEVGGFLNVSSLTPGLDYVFWSVWEHGNGSVPESNSRDFDLSRSQFWQCPGTTIERNFEVGTSLSVSLLVNGSSALDPFCEEFSPESSSSEFSSCRQASSSASYSDGATASAVANDRRRLYGTSDDSRSRSFLSGRRGRGRGHRLLQEDEDTHNATRDQAAGDGGWAWDSDGPRFGLGERSKIRLSSHVLLLDGSDGNTGVWAPLRNTSSASAVEVSEASDEEGEGRAGVITASLDSFEATAVFSTLLYFSSVESAEDSSGSGDEAATWVAIAFAFFLVGLLGWCSIRLSKKSHAAKTWPTEVARAAARNKFGFDPGKESTFGSPSSSDGGTSMGGVKELQIFPVMMAPRTKYSRSNYDVEGTRKSATATSKSSEGGAAPLRTPPAPGWTTPGSGSSKHTTLNSHGNDDHDHDGKNKFSNDEKDDRCSSSSSSRSGGSSSSRNCCDSDKNIYGDDHGNDDDDDDNDKASVLSASTSSRRRLPAEAFPLADVV